MYSLIPRPSPFFTAPSTSVYYTERKPRNKNRGGLGTRLLHVHVRMLCQLGLFSLGELHLYDQHLMCQPNHLHV